LAGLGIGWLPFSMIHQEVQSGALISLANTYGKEPLQVAVYADSRMSTAQSLMEVWTQDN